MFPKAEEEEEPTEPDITEPSEPESTQYNVAAGEDLIIDLEVIENLTSLSFDYKVTSGTFNMALMMSDWGSYYGYYAFNANGSIDGDSKGNGKGENDRSKQHGGGYIDDLVEFHMYTLLLRK